MKRIKMIRFGTLTIFLIAMTIVSFMLLADMSTNNITVAMAALILLAVASGLFIPSVLLSWMVVLILAAGIFTLTIGYPLISNFTRIVVIASYPILSFVTILGRHFIGDLGWIATNRANIEAYVEHYDPAVNFQTLHTASNTFSKSAEFIQKQNKLEVWIDATAVQWSHHEQYKQFHASEYAEILSAIQTILKQDRLPGESIYYVDNATFLIISHTVSETNLMQLNNNVNDQLATIMVDGFKPQFKTATMHINEKNIDKYSSLDLAMNKLYRQMETDIIVEYMQKH